MRMVKLGIDDFVAVWDKESETYEIFLDSDLDVYQGCADTIEQAKEVALWILADQLCF